MLDRLPPELLAEILDVVALFSPVRASETLFACCLVSRAICDVAEPILWRRVELDCDTAATSLFAALRGGHDGRQTRELNMEYYHWIGVGVKVPSLVSSIIEASPCLTKVSFRGGRRTVSAKEASALASLTCEHRFPSSCRPWSCADVLPGTALREVSFRLIGLDGLFLGSYTPSSSFSVLTLIDCTILPSTLESLLETAKTPNLRVLHIVGLRHPVTSLVYAPSLSTELLSRVERVYLQVSDFSDGAATPLISPERVPFKLDRQAYLTRNPTFAPIHITLELPYASQWRNTTLREAIEVFERPLPFLAGTTSLKSFSISGKPPQWRSSHLPTIRTAYDTLLRCAADAGVEVRWVEGHPFDDFGRYLKEKEKEREANVSLGERE
jgi:hypothetical protein